MGRNLRDDFLIVTPTVKELEVEVKAEMLKRVWTISMVSILNLTNKYPIQLETIISVG